MAIYDGTVAAWDSKYIYQRARPSAAAALGVTLPDTPSYPDEYAVAAGAAETVLAYIFPNDAAVFTAWAEEGARSRPVAGVAYPSEVAAGLALGRRVGERAVARGKADGSDATWTGSILDITSAYRRRPGRAAGRHLQAVDADRGRPVPPWPTTGTGLRADGARPGRGQELPTH